MTNKEKRAKVILKEKCDCGAYQIKHNNGGNYHQRLAVKYEGGTYYVRRYDTCELVQHEDYHAVQPKEAKKMMNEFIEKYDCRIIVEPGFIEKVIMKLHSEEG